MNGVDFSGEFNRLSENFWSWVPNMLTALVILLVGWILAVILKSLVDGALVRMGFNRWLHNSQADNFVRKITNDPARTISKFIYWLVFATAIAIAIAALNIPIITALIAGFFSYIPEILAAILILALGIAAAAGIGGLIHRWMGDTPTGKIMGTVLPVIIISITGFAVLTQLKIAPAIVISTYIAIVGALALGFAIAFGLGGVEVAGEILDNAYEASTKNLGRAKRDIEKGKARAEVDRERAKRKIDEENRER